jgi:hypothetical protein
VRAEGPQLKVSMGKKKKSKTLSLKYVTQKGLVEWLKV